MAKRDKFTREQRDRELAHARVRRAEKRRELNPHLPPYEPRAPRGPSGSPPIPHLAEGLELAGQSVRSDAEGRVTSVWDLGRRAGTKPAPIPETMVPTRIAVATRGDGSEAMRWTGFNVAEADRHSALMEAWDRHAEGYEGFVPPAPAPERTNADTLSLYPIGDFHLGMLAWFRETGVSWDLKHGKVALGLAIAELVRMMPDSEHAVLANLGDFEHAQDDTATTPRSGNRLDVDGRHAKVADAALVILVGATDALLAKHRHVTVHHLPGNHDPRVAAGLAREMRAWYRNEPRVTIADAYAVHQYRVFGNSILGFHHGDTTPASELPGIMAHDQRPVWSSTKFGYWHCGHVHHRSKTSLKEYPNVIVETHRILPPGDAYHAGRYRAGRGMTGIVIDREFGEVARATVGIERIQAALSREVAA